MRPSTDPESRLPTPAAYYRPARARALRRQAARVAWWHEALPWMVAVVYVLRVGDWQWALWMRP